MRGSISKITMALVLVCGCWAAAGCSGDDSAMPDGGGGAGGSGGSSLEAGGDTGLVGCVSEAPTACPDPPVTYGRVQPIFEARCASLCHNDRTIDPVADAAIWALTDYRHVADWRDTIRATLTACLMPPPEARVPVTVEERRTILEWVRCGTPQ